MRRLLQLAPLCLFSLAAPPCLSVSLPPPPSLLLVCWFETSVLQTPGLRHLSFLYLLFSGCLVNILGEYVACESKPSLGCDNAELKHVCRHLLMALSCRCANRFACGSGTLAAHVPLPGTWLMLVVISSYCFIAMLSAGQ